MLKYFNIAVIGFGLIIAIVLIKYKPIYKVSISGEEVGYIESKEAFVENIKENMTKETTKNIDTIEIEQEPEYELKLVNRTLKTNEEQVIENIEENAIITYKYYEIAVNNETVDSVNTIEEAEELVNYMKEENQDEELDLTIVEKYTQEEQEVDTIQDIEVAKVEIQEKVTEEIEKQKEQERIDAMPEVNGIKLANIPVSGTITSRYGVGSRIRRGAHTGLDISAKTGTPIQVVANGTVTFASTSGAYGKLVKVDHGNGVETWYAHTSKMYVKPGQEVTAGEIIAAVGSTGNSTGPHLHFEIRINGEHINPQNYLYN